MLAPNTAHRPPLLAEAPATERGHEGYPWCWWHFPPWQVLVARFQAMALLWLALLLLSPAPASMKPDDQVADAGAIFLPAWHFFQSATALEAIGELQEARRAISAALRLEPTSHEFRRVKARIVRACDSARSNVPLQLSVTLKMGSMPAQETVAWNVGDDPYMVACSLAEQLNLADDFVLPLYQLVVSEEERQDLRPPASTTAAPWHIPAELASAFSLHNRSVLRRHYIDDSVRQPRTWTRGALEALVRDARAGAHKFYGTADSHLFAALHTLHRVPSTAAGEARRRLPGLRGKRVAVVSIGCASDSISGAWCLFCVLPYARGCMDA